MDARAYLMKRALAAMTPFQARRNRVLTQRPEKTRYSLSDMEEAKRLYDSLAPVYKNVPRAKALARRLGAQR